MRPGSASRVPVVSPSRADDATQAGDQNLALHHHSSLLFELGRHRFRETKEHFRVVSIGEHHDEILKVQTLKSPQCIIHLVLGAGRAHPRCPLHDLFTLGAEGSDKLGGSLFQPPRRAARCPSWARAECRSEPRRAPIGASAERGRRRGGPFSSRRRCSRTRWVRERSRRFPRSRS